MNIGKVQQLTFDNRNIIGQIRNFNLPGLTWLTIQNNAGLTGSIPNFNLPNLTTLWIQVNSGLTGSIPNFTLNNLTSLYLYGNSLSGNIPNITFANSTYTFNVGINQFNFGNIQNAWSSLNNGSMVTNNAITSGYAPQSTVLPLTQASGILTADLAGANLVNLTYQWYKNGILVATIVGNNKYTPTTTGTYSYKVSHATITQPSIASKNLVLNSASLNVTGVCQSNVTSTFTIQPNTAKVTFTATAPTGSNYVSYTWSEGNITATGNPATLDLLSAYGHQVRLIVDMGGGCKDTLYKYVDILCPATTLSLGANQSVCQGTALSLTATPQGATAPPFSYQWSNNQTTTTINPSSSSVGTTNYAVTATDAIGCEFSTSVSVEIKANPTVSTGGNVTINCTNTSTILQASVAAPLSGGTYVWNNGATQGAAVSPSATTTYTVTTTATNGCSATDTKTITVDKATPIFTTTPNNATITCANTSAILTANGNGTLVWSSGETTSTISVQPLATTAYTVTLTAANTCKSTASATVNVDKTPPTANAGADVSICSGATATLGAANVSTNTYVWSPGGMTASNPTVSPTNTTTYTLLVTGTTNGCTAQQTVKVTVNQNLSNNTVNAASPLASGSGTINNVLTSNAAGTNLSYQWYWEDAAIAGATQATHTATIAGQYKCQVGSACGAGSSNILLVSINPFVYVTMTSNPCVGKVMTAVSNIPALTYQWQIRSSCGSGSWANIGGATDLTYTAPIMGGYRVMLTFASGYSCMAAQKCINMPPCFISPTETLSSKNHGLQEIYENIDVLHYEPEIIAADEVFETIYLDENIKTTPIEEVSFDVFPNPIQHSATLQYNLPENGEVELSITDTRGIKTILWKKEKTVGEYKENLDNTFENLPAGLYFITMSTNNKVMTKKIVKM